MALTLTLLRDSARSKSDEQSTGYVSNVELNRYLNQGLHYIYGKIAQRFEDYFIVRGSLANGGLISVVSGTDEYDLPSTMIKLVRTEYRQANSTTENDWRVLQRVNIGTDVPRTYSPMPAGYGELGGYGYFVAGNKLYLRTVPYTAYSLRLWFIPRATEMAADPDVPGIPAEYHELLAEYGALQILAKSGESLYKERSEAFQLELANMIETIEVRNQNSEQMIVTEYCDYYPNDYLKSW